MRPETEGLDVSVGLGFAASGKVEGFDREDWDE